MYRILFSLGLLLLPLMAPAAPQVEIPFYTERCLIPYDPGMRPGQVGDINTATITRFYAFLERSPHQMLLRGLEQEKVRLGLNDWLFFRLAEQTVATIFRDYGEVERTLINWFLLSKSGYDARITFRQDQVYLCVFTREKIFEAPMIRDQGRTFVNLSEIGRPTQEQSPVYLLDYVPNPRGQAFSFSLRKMPRFRAEIEQKYLKFTFKDSLYHWPVQINRTLIRLMEDYPFINEIEYLQAPMSNLLLNSLVPQMKLAVRQMPVTEAVQFMAVFTRSAFRYMEDKSYFGRSKPMIPDEVLHYPFSDCEDRSALFYALVKHILDLPMVIVAYPDHLTVGVHLPDTPGEAIYFRGNRYLVCDPTGPYDSAEIGKIPRELKGSPYEIIHHFE